MSTGTMDPQPPLSGADRSLDVERDSDVPISTQIYWQLAYQIDSGRLLPGARLAPVRELGGALRVNPNMEGVEIGIENARERLEERRKHSAQLASAVLV